MMWLIYRYSFTTNSAKKEICEQTGTERHEESDKIYVDGPGCRLRRGIPDQILQGKKSLKQSMAP